jgi:peptide/nickel transport system permease protein
MFADRIEEWEGLSAYIARRLIQAVPLLLIISFIAFAIVQATGDPLAAYTVDASLTSDDIARLRARYGLDQPMPLQYLSWLGNMLTGDWGTSYYTRENVVDMVLDRLPNTLLLVGISYTVILISAVILGIVSAVRQYSLLDHLITGASFVGIAIPSFWLGLMLIVMFSVQFKARGLPYFPVGGMFDQREGETMAQVLWHAVLPATTLAVVITARYVRYIRAAILEQVQVDYVRTARSKGLPEHVVLLRHVFKNALLPLITLIALDVPSLLSGAIVIESIFAWPGMGRLFWSAAERTDIPVLMATMLLVAVLTVIANLVADALYAVADPRIRYQ